MKIMIPVDEKKNGTGVCPSFGRAPYYMLFDVATREIAYLDNPAADAPGGAGIKAAQFVADQKADVLLTPRCGENAGEVLKTAGVLLFKTVAGSAEENIAAYEAGTLSPITQFHEGFHGKQ
ncbi:MAG TPA: dinitrogenase iron-molybdenum cofactor biosynthesis protein [Clostridiales bacterium]|nr:dinitrogenase iron-molybdenum cofactor biosynthesis protein [Clostridiales bacterium]